MEPMYVTRDMIIAAEKFQSACIDAGFDYASVRYEDKSWSLDGNVLLRVFGIDRDNKSHEWSQR